MKLKMYLVEQGVLINNIYFEKKKKYQNNVYNMLLSWVYILTSLGLLLFTTLFIYRNFELPCSKGLYLCCMFELLFQIEITLTDM